MVFLHFDAELAQQGAARLLADIGVLGLPAVG
jgi:hypothetical protein